LTVDARARLAAALRGELRFDEPMARHTSLKVGGPADFFAVPDDMADLLALMGAVIETGLPYLVVGGGYNLLVRDGGFRGVVISPGRLSGMETLPGSRLRAEAGVTNQMLVGIARKEQLSGLEFLSGIPGTVGGALSMNAGAHGRSVLELVESLTTLQEGKVTVTLKEKLRYGYRRLELKPGEIVLAAVFSLAAGNVGEIEGRIAAYLDQRRSNQQVGYPNAGSFFKNPEGRQAWRLIDEAGLRGYRIGGAQVSEVHSNFLVNRGGATAADFLELAEVIKEKVREQSGIDLEEEVRIVGVD
jgi:UDP-N-acetylmuramate dehydrogenase